MFIPYYKLAQTIALFLPSKFRSKLRLFGYNAKIKRNEKFIKKNKKHVLKNLRKKVKKQKLVAAFYIYDETKWKCQSIYDLLEESGFVDPYIFVTKNDAPKENFNYQKSCELKKIYDFFKEKNMRVSYAYDIKNEMFIPFEKMNPRPDIIFYQHPWYIEASQGPVVCSKFALTFYVPYFVATSVSPIEYYLRFHRYVQTHYVLNNLVKDYFSRRMENKGKNLKPLGHPMLDYFYLNKGKTFEDKEYVIYAPHWSVDNKNDLFWGTFLWAGKFMLNYAKNHPEINWVFKPHPCLANYLKKHNYMKEDEIKAYWNEWEKIGQVCETGGYLEMFMQSKAMITDCGSFETEYFLTKKPLIHLKSLGATPFNPSVTKIVENYYNVTDENQLMQALDSVLIENNDFMREKRLTALQELGYENNYAAFNIINDIKELLGVI